LFQVIVFFDSTEQTASSASQQHRQVIAAALFSGGRFSRWVPELKKKAKPRSAFPAIRIRNDSRQFSRRSKLVGAKFFPAIVAVNALCPPHPRQLSSSSRRQLSFSTIASSTIHSREVHPRRIRSREVHPRQSILDKSILDTTILDKSILDKSVLKKSILDKSILDKSVLEKSILDKSVLKKSILDKSILDKAILDTSILAGSMLAGFILVSTILANAFFANRKVLMLTPSRLPSEMNNQKLADSPRVDPAQNGERRCCIHGQVYRSRACAMFSLAAAKKTDLSESRTCYGSTQP
jgi:uncharacterized protein YjbI with pentapeptide repeats